MQSRVGRPIRPERMLHGSRLGEGRAGEGGACFSGVQLVCETTQSCTADFAKVLPRDGNFFIALAVTVTRDFMQLPFCSHF